MTSFLEQHHTLPPDFSSIFPKVEKITRCAWHCPCHQALFSASACSCLHARPSCARAWGMVAVSTDLDKICIPLGRTLPGSWLPSRVGLEDQATCHSMVLPLSLLTLFLSTYKIWLASLVLLNFQFNSLSACKTLKTF